ncbi:MAG: LysR family transcriptional regulator [Pseudomonadota bacterium]
MKWDDLRVFLALARAGSFAGAGRALSVNQSTVSRRLASLEADLGARLLERGGEGLFLTATGEELLALAQGVEQGFERIDRRLVGRDARLSGRLTVTCVDMMVDRYLAPHLTRFATDNPEIELNLATAFQPLDLARREADVAIRVSADPPETLVGRRLMDFALGVYGAPEFIEALGEAPDPENVPWIGWNSESTHQRMIADHFPTAGARHRVDSLLAASALARAGLGATVLPCYWADRDPGLRRLYPQPIANHRRGLWVLAHPDVRKAARVRAFTRFVSEVLLAERDLFEGRVSV